MKRVVVQLQVALQHSLMHRLRQGHMTCGNHHNQLTAQWRSLKAVWTLPLAALVAERQALMSNGTMSCSCPDKQDLPQLPTTAGAAQHVHYHCSTMTFVIRKVAILAGLQTAAVYLLCFQIMRGCMYSKQIAVRLKLPTGVTSEHMCCF